MVRPAEKWSFFLGPPENTRGPNWDLPVMSGPVSGSLGLDQHSRDLLSPPRDLFTYLGLQLFSGVGDK